MYNEDQNRQQSGQGVFVRRPIPQQSKFNGGEKTNTYQNSGYTPSYGGSGGNNYNSPSRQYGGGDQQRRHEGGGYSGGSGGYSGGGGYRGGGYSGGGRTGGYSAGGGRTGGYSGGGDRGGSTDRLIRQNDIIIKMLKDIRDRLPAPPGYRDLPDPSYSSGEQSQQYAGSEQSYAADDAEVFDVSAAPGEPEDGNAGDGEPGNEPEPGNAVADESGNGPEPGNAAASESGNGPADSDGGEGNFGPEPGNS